MPHLSNNLLARRLKDGVSKFTNYRYVYPYRNLLPPALKDQVSNRGDERERPPCLQEISMMLVCLKKYEFEESHCAKEIEAFRHCNEEYKKNLGREDPDSTTVKKYSSDRVNRMLQKYPQPVERK